MKERIFSLIGGFVLSLGVILLVIYLFSLTPKVELNLAEQPDPSKLESIGDTTKGLTNNGDLPKQVSQADAGRSNPFDNY